MKFSWGTGIFIFLILFVSAGGVFIIFAMRQDVNLVHEDYYEQGADHGQRMRVDERSVPFIDSVKTSVDDEYFRIEFARSVRTAIDSGSVLLFRPSSSSLDVKFNLVKPVNSLAVPRTELADGRYILKLSWYIDELEYALERSVFVE